MEQSRVLRVVMQRFGMPLLSLALVACSDESGDAAASTAPPTRLREECCASLRTAANQARSALISSAEMSACWRSEESE